MVIFKSSKTMHNTSVSLSIAAFVALYISGLLVHLSATNQHNAYAQLSSPDNNKTLFVTGSASTQIKPDRVTVSLGVETTNTKAKAALAANSELMNKIINALKTAGVKVSRKLYIGTTHEFFGTYILVPDAQDAQNYAASEFKNAFGF